jgi:hypothetical protein
MQQNPPTTRPSPTTVGSETAEAPLEVLAVGNVSWRVRPEGHEDGRLLALVQKDGAEFDVMCLTPAPVACGRFAVWEEVLTALRACFAEVERHGEVPVVLRDRGSAGEYLAEGLLGPDEPSASPPEVTTVPLSLTLYQAMCGDRIVGFVESVHPVWVVLDGYPYAWATEVAQASSFCEALQVLAASRPIAPAPQHTEPALARPLTTSTPR